MRDLIPFVDQVNELSNIFGENAPEIELHCTLFEDNNGALELATKPRYRPRTKHIAVKYHYFRENSVRPRHFLNTYDRDFLNTVIFF